MATSDPRATDVAIDVLVAGGNAVDAAVAATLVLFVVEPQSCGVAGDAFSIVADGGAPVAYDGSGNVPAALTADALRASGFDGVPARGGASATVPGAPALLERLLAERGTMELERLVEPAVALATDGFEVRTTLATAAQRAAREIGGDPVLGPLYVPSGTPVAVGETVHNPALAACLSTIAREGSRAIYHGSLGSELVDAVQRDRGYLSLDDLAAHETLRVVPEHVDFWGRTVWQLPAPTQGPAVLRTLEALDASMSVDGPVDWSLVLDAMRAGMAVSGFDPAAMGPRQSPAKGDTTYLAVIDRDGLAVSLITSVFGDFGSHLGIAALGGPVHNRATTLRMLHRDPAPGRPPHTTIPGMVTDPSGAPVCCIGVAGGIMQPQTQVQVLIRMLCEGQAPQAAIDAPRFKICFGGDVALEEGHPLAPSLATGLGRDPGPEGFGNAQVVTLTGSAVVAGADQRRGGSARVLD